MKLPKLRHLILILTILAISCNERKNETKDPEITQTKPLQFLLSDSVYVILEIDPELDWMFQDLKDVKPATITESELAEVESIIEKAIEDNNRKQLEELEFHNKNNPDRPITESGYELRTEGYKRQYVPMLNSKGQKEVWINFFCSDNFNDSWRKGVVWVLDGGNCYFNLRVNLATKTYSELRINGYA